MPIIYGYCAKMLKNVARVIKENKLSMENIVDIHEQLIDAADHVEMLEKRLSQKRIDQDKHVQSLMVMKKLSVNMGALLKEFEKHLPDNAPLVNELAEHLELDGIKKD